MVTNFGEEFEKLVAEMLALDGYKVRPNLYKNKSFDLTIERENEEFYVEVKFYRSRKISASLIRDSAYRMAFIVGRAPRLSKGIIVVNVEVSSDMKLQVLRECGITIWDRDIVYQRLSNLSIELKEQFEKLLSRAQQGTDIREFVREVDVDSELTKLVLEAALESVPVLFRATNKPKTDGADLCKELESIKEGKSGWPEYERKCLQILKFLFVDDLTLWQEQPTTEDELSRFDLICRIASQDDYWKAIVSSFNTRFILFEFKNYSMPIEQGQIYTTEKYLFSKGLRSVGFIIARKGASSNAIKAAKGALKEHGKLILILSNIDLCTMLNMKDRGESPNDYLSNSLDNWLISLSR